VNVQRDAVLSPRVTPEDRGQIFTQDDLAGALGELEEEPQFNEC